MLCLFVIFCGDDSCILEILLSILPFIDELSSIEYCIAGGAGSKGFSVSNRFSWASISLVKGVSCLFIRFKVTALCK